MKKFKLKTGIITIAIISVMVIACKKNTVEEVIYPPCPYALVSVMVPPNILLDIRDKQGRDLLSPATPGHYDTAQIRQLNTGLVRYIPKVANGARIILLLDYQLGEKTSYLKLSPTDQDTLYTNYEDRSSRCAMVHALKTFRYNGTVMTDSLGRYFTAVK